MDEDPASNAAGSQGLTGSIPVASASRRLPALAEEPPWKGGGCRKAPCRFESCGLRFGNGPVGRGSRLENGGSHRVAGSIPAVSAQFSYAIATLP